MRYLYIDTSSNFLYAGIVENKKLLVEIKKEIGQKLSEETLPEIASMFKSIKLNPNEIDKIIVVNGPGSFTGIRIGITIAKVYAWSLKKKITSITSLEAMALSSKKKKIHVPIIDARRGYVYAAIYNEDYDEIMAPQHIELDKLKEKLKDISEYEFISNDEIKNIQKPEKYNPDIYKIVDYFKDKKDINPHIVNPEYLKLTAAEESKL